jgi:hypothetical protein
VGKPRQVNKARAVGLVALARFSKLIGALVHDELCQSV